MTDAKLLRLIQAGDAAALETLYQRCLPSVWRFVYARVGNRHAAEDIVSETFLGAIRSVATYLPETGSAIRWLIGIARHKLADHGRARTEVPSALVFDRPTDSADFDNLDLREQVLFVLDQMDDDERQVLEWKYLEGLSVAAVAERLGRTEKAVEALLYRARRTFRALLPIDIQSRK